jgi:hypothetical protein
MDYIDSAGLRVAPKDTPLNQTALKRQRRLSSKRIHVNNICRMMKRRLKDIGLPSSTCPIHSVSPRSRTCWRKVYRLRMCNNSPGTPILARRAFMTAGSENHTEYCRADSV